METRNKNMNWLQDIKTEELCEQHQDIVRCIGWDNTLKLIGHFGKTGIYFSAIKPGKPLDEDYQTMVTLIGFETTLKLVGHFKGELLHLNGLDEVIREKKHEYIVGNFKGNNQKELARITGISEQHVYKILRQENEKKRMARQLKLF